MAIRSSENKIVFKVENECKKVELRQKKIHIKIFEKKKSQKPSVTLIRQKKHFSKNCINKNSIESTN